MQMTSKQEDLQGGGNERMPEVREYVGIPMDFFIAETNDDCQVSI
jgi:hypothetical protein